jgi:predicted nucleic acid-binding protein
MAGREEAVIDASVAVKWLSEEEGTDAALTIREKHIEGTTILSAPNLLLYELANAFRYKPDFNEEKVLRGITDVLDLEIDLISPSRELIEKTIEDAYMYELTIYDSCYLALGELLGIVVYTSDKKFYEKAKKSGILRLI